MYGASIPVRRRWSLVRLPCDSRRVYAYFQEIVADVLHHFHADHSIERALPFGRQGPVVHEIYADPILESSLLNPLFGQFELIAG